MKAKTHFWPYLNEFFSEQEMFQTKVVEKIKTDILRLIRIFFFQKSWHLWGNVEKYFTAGHATDRNIAHAHFVLDN